MGASGSRAARAWVFLPKNWRGHCAVWDTVLCETDNMRGVAVLHRGGILRGGRGIGILLRWLLHVVAWGIVFHALRGFLVHYTHVPWLGAIIVTVVVVALLRAAVRARRRSRL